MDKLQLLALVVGVLLPVLVGIVTTKVTSGGVKAVLLALLTAVTGVLTDVLATPDGFDLKTSVVNWLGAFIMAVATHFGFLKPAGISDFVQAKIGRTASPTSSVRAR